MRKVELISIREYARRLSIDDKAVRNAIDAGLIKKGFDAKHKKIKPTIADREWGYKHKVIKPRGGVSRTKALEKLQLQNPDHTKSENIGDIEIEDFISTIQITSDLNAAEAMRIREVIGAALDKKK